MRFKTTDGSENGIEAKEALARGVGQNGALFIPELYPQVDIDSLSTLSLQEVSFKMANLFFGKDLPKRDLEEVIHNTVNYPIPVKPISQMISFVELFHGPTLSFKDFGARFLAQMTAKLLKPKEKRIFLVATTGDTGSAVGMAFRDIPNTRVCILFPKGKVTKAQEKQLTTIGGHVLALEIDGSFDTCQQLVDQALSDGELEQVTIANSVNVIRLVAQSFYFFYALKPSVSLPVVSIPCGNFGHLVSGLIAKKMGLKVERFVAATNVNDEIPLFLRSGVFSPHPSKKSLAPSMDVGNPSNFTRLLALYHENLDALRRDVMGISVTDEEIKTEIATLYKQSQIILDPHSAAGYVALRNYLALEGKEHRGVLFATAHPAKFATLVEPIIGQPLSSPNRLDHTPRTHPHKIPLEASYETFKDFLLTAQNSV